MKQYIIAFLFNQVANVHMLVFLTIMSPGIRWGILGGFLGLFAFWLKENARLSLISKTSQVTKSWFGLWRMPLRDRRNAQGARHYWQGIGYAHDATDDGSGFCDGR
ncbi:MAG TPA: hypothetical protein PKH24_20455, partial [Sedimentisphaerales bacterium]|nr:hypothetical protein [Sedimentisphaerales bacterium]HNU31182.1 hypothetical protein [Sedimentisphaerales bacterium]